MPRFRIRGKFDFQAWPETSHSARVLRKIARETAEGHTHIVSAALVMTAFSVEAFAKTLGPAVYGDAWNAAPRPAERFPIKIKVKDIARARGITVDYGARPWKDLASLMTARDALAHPGPHPRPVDDVVEAVDGVHARLLCDDIIRREYRPLHDIDVLDEVADRVEAGLLEIWVAGGGSRNVLKAWTAGLWSVSPEP